MKTCDVAVIGGGPCGLFAALLLARQGVRCLVLERHPSISQHPKAMGLTRRTCEIFRQCGLLAAIERGSLDLEGRSLAFWGKSLVGEELGRVPLAGRISPFTPCETLHCPQTWTEKVLLDALNAEPLAEIHFGTRVENFEEGASHVTLRIQGGDEVEAQWVVAADGAGSQTRKALEIGTEGPGDLGHFINIMFRADYGDALEDRKAVLYNALGEDFYEFFVAVDGKNLWLMHHFLQPGENAEDVTDAWLEETIRMASGLPGVPVEILGRSPWVMSPSVAKTWRQGRIFLVGDAAARLSPAGGLGLNTGLQGTHNLAWKLAAVVQGQAADALLDSYEAERRPTALDLMHKTNKNADEIFAIISAAMRGDWDAAKAGIAGSRRRGSGLGQDLGQIYAQGAFLAEDSQAPEVRDPINDYQPCAKPGCRAPHLKVQECEDTSTLLDFFGQRFVILGGKSGGSWRSPGVPFHQNGVDFACEDFEQTYGITSAGAILVRPDGIVAGRFPRAKSPADPDLTMVMDQLLHAARQA